MSLARFYLSCCVSIKFDKENHVQFMLLSQLVRGGDCTVLSCLKVKVVWFTFSQRVRDLLHWLLHRNRSVWDFLFCLAFTELYGILDL